MSSDQKRGFIAKLIGPKKRWRERQAQVEQLPAGHRAAVEALERYLLNFVPTDSDKSVTMLEDLADLFARAAQDGTGVREVVGADPVRFADDFAANYTESGYVSEREKTRLAEAITRADGGGAR